MMKEQLEAIRKNALESIAATHAAADLDALRVRYLGKKGELTALLKQMGSLSAELRPVMGQMANEVRASLEQAIESQADVLAEKALEAKLNLETVDVTIPGKKTQLGHKHPMYTVLDEIKEIFIDMGFEILDGPEIARIEAESGIPVGTTGMMAAIESARGVLNAAEIARSSTRLIGIALGAEDYVTDLKTTRSDGIELLFARSMILNAARAAGIAALDTVYSDVNNEEGFLAEATLIKKLGFDGKSVINPRQIEPLHKVFMPSEKDLAKARAVMNAIEEAHARGSGVASLNGKMIDKPVVTRAKRLLDLYEAGSKVHEVEEI